MTTQFIGKETIPCFSLFTISSYRLHDQHKVCMGFSRFVTNLYPPEPFSTLCMENHSPHTAQSRNATHSGLSSGIHPTGNEIHIPPLVSRHHVIHARPALQAPVHTSPLHSTLLHGTSHFPLNMEAFLPVCTQVIPVVSNSAALWTAARQAFLCPWNSPGKNTGVGRHVLFQGILPTQGSNLSLSCFLHWQADSLPLHHLESPKQERCALNPVILIIIK